ncbi:MAG: hypothetical protein RL619_131 [Bacteroidota bacterium]|jgi:hypothetical protein
MTIKTLTLSHKDGYIWDKGQMLSNQCTDIENSSEKLELLCVQVTLTMEKQVDK